MPSSPAPVIRPALPGELPAIIAIDDATAPLFVQVGLVFDFDDDHPFIQAEHAAWARHLREGRVFVTTDTAGLPAGFIALGFVDGQAYIEQVSVHPTHMGRGLGRALIEHAKAWARTHGSSSLWLNTYAHVPWNAPYYQRLGFMPVPADAWGPQMRQTLALQQRHLPHPDKRVVMVCRL